MLRQISGVSSPHQNKEKKFYIIICFQTPSFQGTPELHVDLSRLDCYLWGHVKTLACSAPIENEEILHQHIFYAHQVICSLPGAF
jgi:hypothetical protein